MRWAHTGTWEHGRTALSQLCAEQAPGTQLTVALTALAWDRAMGYWKLPGHGMGCQCCSIQWSPLEGCRGWVPCPQTPAPWSPAATPCPQLYLQDPLPHSHSAPRLLRAAQGCLCCPSAGAGTGYEWLCVGGQGQRELSGDPEGPAGVLTRCRSPCCSRSSSRNRLLHSSFSAPSSVQRKRTSASSASNLPSAASLASRSCCSSSTAQAPLLCST